jgi:hypothetical protein
VSAVINGHRPILAATGPTLIELELSFSTQRGPLQSLADRISFNINFFDFT